MNYTYVLLVVIAILAISITNISLNAREAFSLNTMSTSWSPDLIRRFKQYQTTVNLNNYQFNLQETQRQATPQEVEELLHTGYWPWSKSVKQLFLQQISQNQIINIDYQIALDNARKIYNENAASQLLAWNTNEGKFLLYGVNIGSTETDSDSNNGRGILNVLPNNTIKCVNNPDGTTTMKKTTYLSPNLWNGGINQQTEELSPQSLPDEIPGFSFINNSCNPCVAINNDFSCPFAIKVKNEPNKPNKPNKLNIWDKLWGL